MCLMWRRELHVLLKAGRAESNDMNRNKSDALSEIPCFYQKISRVIKNLGEGSGEGV